MIAFECDTCHKRVRVVSNWGKAQIESMPRGWHAWEKRHACSAKCFSAFPKRKKNIPIPVRGNSLPCLAAPGQRNAR